MKIKRSVLERIIREELANHIHEMMEAAPKDKEDTEVVDASAEKKSKEKPGGKGEENPTKPQGSTGVKQPGGNVPPEVQVADEPEADDELATDVATPDEEEDPAEITGGKISDEIAGKTIQSISMEPKSKLLPGAMEIAMTFREIPDPLKILITKTGQVKFHFKWLHNEL